MERPAGGPPNLIGRPLEALRRQKTGEQRCGKAPPRSRGHLAGSFAPLSPHGAAAATSWRGLGHSLPGGGSLRSYPLYVRAHDRETTRQCLPVSPARRAPERASVRFKPHTTTSARVSHPSQSVCPDAILESPRTSLLGAVDLPRCLKLGVNRCTFAHRNSSACLGSTAVPLSKHVAPWAAPDPFDVWLVCFLHVPALFLERPAGPERESPIGCREPTGPKPCKYLVPVHQAPGSIVC